MGAEPGKRSNPILTGLRSAAILAALAGFLYFLSLLAYSAFFLGARLTHSVPAARAFDAVGAVFLFPGNFALRKMPAYLVSLPSVIVPVNAAIWLLMICAALLFSGKNKSGS